MKQTPLMKLIEWIDLQRQNELTVLNDSNSYHYNDVRQAHTINTTCQSIIQYATELLAEEREAMLQSYIQGYVERDDPDSEYYFTQTYGGGDE